ncbi:MAG: TIM barrel protein, partial [Clostridia bacterium]|nr:TIM barrel protein [Clostridia bacterium]
MKTSTEINSASRIVGEEKAIELIAKAGFDAWDFSMFSMGIYDWGKKTFNFETGHPLSGKDYLAFARKLKKIGEDNGIHCNQSHAPFPSGSEEVFPYLLRAIECTAEAGGEICVIHPESFSTPEQNAEMYAKLLEFSKPMGVKIATENMWGWNSEKNRAGFAACATPESFVAHVDALNDDYMVACLDIGHAEMMDDTNAVELIKALSHRLKSLH